LGSSILYSAAFFAGFSPCGAISKSILFKAENHPVKGEFYAIFSTNVDGFFHCRKPIFNILRKAYTKQPNNWIRGVVPEQLGMNLIHQN
jgi:hypothetical protein